VSEPPLLEAEDLTVQYSTREGELTAVSDATFRIEEGEYVGLIGESGSGKSTVAKAIMKGLDSNGRITSGSLRYKGKDLVGMSEAEMNEEIRWTEISWIPQGSMNSLDPLQRVSDQAVEIANDHTDMPRDEVLERFRELFEIVGLPEERINDYPFQFSGGMQQRAIIALALFLDPSLVIADEPTTALDVIMQDQVFKYLKRIRDVSDTSLMLITHDISLVFESCDEMLVMHAGQIAESGTVTEVYDEPRHPYTILLKEAFPDIRDLDRDLRTIPGKPTTDYGEIDYCTFADRCPWAVPECRQGAPPLEPSAKEDSDTHRIACIRRDEVLEEYRSSGSPAIPEGDG